MATLVFGVGNVWGDETGFTATKLTGSTGSWTGTNGETWNFSQTEGATGQNVTNGYWQIGTGKSPATSISISTDGISGTITQIQVDCSSKGGSAKVNATVGGENFGTQNQSTPSWTTGGNVTFTGSANGAIVITMSGSTGATYLKSVTVTYTAGGGSGDVDTPSVEVASTSVNATAAETDGTINVTYNNITDVAADVFYCEDDGTTSTTYGWIEAEIDASNNLYYMINANTGAERTAYLKVWAYDDDMNEVYSDLITVTQAAAPVAVTGVTLDMSTAEVEVGSTVTLTATIAPAAATNKNVSWTTSNSSVATVDNGVVTGVAVGTATITVSTVDGDFTATCDVTVKTPSTPTVTLDFTDNSDWSFPEGSANKATDEDSFTDGNGYTIKLAATTGYYYNTDGYLMLGKTGSTLTLPAFPFNVKKIEVVGKSTASGSVKMNIYVGETAVSTETTGATGTSTYAIADNQQAAGTVYTLKVNSNHNTQITAIKIYGYENVAVSDAGYATYCSDNALDFSDVTGLTAYTASMNGNNVEFDKVDGAVAANTGLLVKAAEGTYSVPAVATGTDVSATNKLKGVTSVTTIGKQTDDNFNYVLKDGSDGVGFYQVNNDNYKVRANSAYLAISYDAASAGAKLFIGLDGETSVEAVAAEVLPTGTAYNLQGQRVGNDYKGVVIVNGKKVIR